MGWYQKHRPKTLEEVLGQDHVTKPLQGMLKKGTVPQFLLFGGPSGVGKTTVARILKEELECSDIDFTEVNAATSGGIDFVRDLRKSIGLHSLGGKSRVWLVDECFPAGTEVTLINGRKRIEDVQVGEVVVNVKGVGTVERTFENKVPLNAVVRLKFSDGTSLVTTDRHEFLTDCGWVEAKSLTGLSLFRPSSKLVQHQRSTSHADLRILPTTIQVQKDQGGVLFQVLRFKVEESEQRTRTARHLDVSRMQEGVHQVRTEVCGAEVLFSIVRCQKQIEKTRDPSEVVLTGNQSKSDSWYQSVLPNRRGAQGGFGVFAENEHDQSDGQRGNRPKDEADQVEKRDFEPTYQEPGWQRNGIDCSAKASVGSTWRGTTRLETRSYSPNQSQSYPGRFADSLQGGHRPSEKTGGGGGEWTLSQYEKDFIGRCQKETEVNRVRVDGVEFYEQGSNDEAFNGFISDYDRLRGFVVFYDLQVSGHPSYLANGVVAHNCHASTTAAQQAMLKETEDVPKNVYFIFASSEPDKLIKALQTRATRFDFRSLAVDDQMELLRTVAAAENLDFEKKVLQEIVEAADGSARRAIVLLEQAAAAQDVNEQLVIVHRGNVKAQAISLCREMLSGSWSQAAKTLSHLDDDPEGVRRLILSYMTKTLLGGGKTTEKAARAIQCCQYNLFDSGKAGLVLAVYEFFNGN